ncbi:hypothetical protein TNCV_1244461 [Trichonephila clavipes]|nr:hypothetical protein TNCV_1244461 [Trichonephila clavipes]
MTGMTPELAPLPHPTQLLNHISERTVSFTPLHGRSSVAQGLDNAGYSFATTRPPRTNDQSSKYGEGF